MRQQQSILTSDEKSHELQVKSPGQLEYEEDLKSKPLYHDGTPRKSWKELDEVSRWSWEVGVGIDSIEK